MAGKSQKGRKIGRNRAKASAKVYLTAKRWETNKAKKIARHFKRMAKKAGLSVPEYKAKHPFHSTPRPRGWKPLFEIPRF